MRGVTMSIPRTAIPRATSENVLGAAIKGRRDKVLISTKATFRFSEEPNDVGSSRFHLITAVDAALRRLGTDYIDLFQLHAFDAMTPAEEVMSTLDTLVRAGQDSLRRGLELLRLARHEVARGGGKIRLPPFRRNQTYYSLIGRDY